MAIGWLAVLKHVPWSEVIRNAPKLVEGARKLWCTIGKKTVPPASPGTSPALNPGGVQPVEVWEARLAALETQVVDLQQQLLASSELIKELADQHALLIRRIEIHRVRMMWLGLATAGAVAVALFSLF